MEIRASISPGEVRAALWDGRLLDFALSRPGGPGDVGDLHRGRVIARVPAMAGAFVALDGGEGFLPDNETNARVAPGAGTVLGVRITRAAQAGKGPRLSARLTPSQAGVVGDGAPALIARGPDALARMMALYPKAAVRLDDAGRAGDVAGAFTLVARAFDDEIEQAIDALSAPEAALGGGARMSVHPTPALVAIDVDLGGQTAERRDKKSAQHDSNRRLIPELCRQILLRNLSGAIVVDLAGMTARTRLALAPDFTAALARDRLAPKFLGFSALGLAEILRPRLHPALFELNAGPHAAGLSALRALARDIAATPHLAPVLRCSPGVATALRRDVGALADLANRAGRPLMLREDRGLRDDCWTVESIPRG